MGNQTCCYYCVQRQETCWSAWGFQQDVCPPITISTASLLGAVAVLIAHDLGETWGIKNAATTIGALRGFTKTFACTLLLGQMLYPQVYIHYGVCCVVNRSSRYCYRVPFYFGYDMTHGVFHSTYLLYTQIMVYMFHVCVLDLHVMVCTCYVINIYPAFITHDILHFTYCIHLLDISYTVCIR